ncbi:MAG: hypothetical protein WBI55_07235 [Eubacteriales bacterium]
MLSQLSYVPEETLIRLATAVVIITYALYVVNTFILSFSLLITVILPA